jgi:hypothetical protein
MRIVGGIILKIDIEPVRLDGRELTRIQIDPGVAQRVVAAELSEQHDCRPRRERFGRRFLVVAVA